MFYITKLYTILLKIKKIGNEQQLKSLRWVHLKSTGNIVGPGRMGFSFHSRLYVLGHPPQIVCSKQSISTEMISKLYLRSLKNNCLV